MAELGTVSRSRDSILEFMLNSVSRKLEKALESAFNVGLALI